VGDGPDRQALTTLASDLGVGSRVIFTGHRSHVGCLLGASDIYVQASAWEGICFALLEAMAVGLPCVISDLAALNEAVDGCGAPVVAVGEVGQLAAALDVLLSDQAASTDLGKRLEVRWGQRFTVERMASNHRAAYMAAAGGEDRA
jgi:glycosyltransferase involved in cell wall biosynthesis